MNEKMHPGELLLEELLERGYIPNDFAEQFGLDPQVVLDLCKKESSIDSDLADKLASSLGTSSALWMNLQKSFDEKRMPGDIGC
ncbi:MAG: HigA family addiction module antidote protein [Candidatus Omnitrophica bacterium]|nr:HigA family addiction module antidote protein [Candidatus Omnitrophota bacterium]